MKALELEPAQENAGAEAGMENAVVFENVTKSYPGYNRITGGIKSFLFNLPQAVRELKQRWIALNDISFEIKKGETFGFIGRNGAGKSTTLGLIAGVLSPEKGRVEVNGRISPLLELGAGFHPELTGRENIMLNGVLLGLTKEEVLEHEEEIIEFSELEKFIDQPVRTYSSGMYAKLGFSVISTLKPEILLVDEVLSVGDIAFVEKCMRKMDDFRRNKNITIIMVSHAMSSVRELCDRAAWIEDRKLKMTGPATEVVDAYMEATRHMETVISVGQKARKSHKRHFPVSHARRKRSRMNGSYKIVHCEKERGQLMVISSDGEFR